MSIDDYPRKTRRLTIRLILLPRMVALLLIPALVSAQCTVASEQRAVAAHCSLITDHSSFGSQALAESGLSARPAHPGPGVLRAWEGTLAAWRTLSEKTRTGLIDRARLLPRYTYSVIIGSLAYHWTHSIFWLSMTVAATLLLPLVQAIRATPDDQAKRISLLRDNKKFRRSLNVLLVGQLLVPIPWALPYVAEDILRSHSLGTFWIVTLLTTGFWAGNRGGAYAQKRWNVARHRHSAWQAGFFGSSALMILMTRPIALWVWYAAVMALGMTLSMGFIVTKTMVHEEPESTRKHADVLYDLYVYGGAAAGVILFGWLANGVGASSALFVNGIVLAVFEGLLAFPDLLESRLSPFQNLRQRLPKLGEIPLRSRKFVVRHPSFMYSAIAGVLAGYRNASWKIGLTYFAAARAAILLTVLILKIGLPWYGHDEKYRYPENLVYPEPPVHSVRGLSKPGHPRSIEPFVWQADPGQMREDGAPVREYDTVVLSDIHLRDPHMREELLLDFLRHHRFKRLILLGDIMDYQIHRPMTPGQREILRTLGRLALDGVEIVYVPGNHDKRWRRRARQNRPIRFKNEKGEILISIPVALEYDWELPDGRKAHAIHGDKFDRLTIFQRIGGWFYDHLLDLDNWIQRERQSQNIFSESYIGKGAKRLAKSYLRTARKKLAEMTAGRGATVGFAGHTHDGEIRRLKVRLKSGQIVEVVVVNTDNSQNPLHVGAVGIRPMRGLPDDGQIELIQWKRLYGNGSKTNPVPPAESPKSDRHLAQDA